MATRVLGFIVAVGVLCCLGCSEGPKRVPVTGQVLIDGQPLEHGSIQVIPADDTAAHGEIGPDGHFQLKTLGKEGCAIGKHKVAIVATETLTPQSQKWHAPKKYMSPETSELEVEITESTNSLLIELSWGSGKPFVEHASAE